MKDGVSGDGFAEGSGKKRRLKGGGVKRSVCRGRRMCEEGKV